MTLGHPLMFFIFGVALTVLTPNVFALERRSTDQIKVDWALSKEIDGVIKGYFNFEKPTVIHYVYNGTVLLIGKIEDPRQKLGLATLVAERPKVRQVVNEIYVPGMGTSPYTANVVPGSGSSPNNPAAWMQTAERVKNALNREFEFHSGIPLAEITKVSYNGSAIYLMGLVTESEANLISSIAARTPGVGWVIRAFEIISQADADKIFDAFKAKNASNQPAIPAPTSNTNSDEKATKPDSQGVSYSPISNLDELKKKCAELGLKAGTEKFGDCVLKLSK